MANLENLTKLNIGSGTWNEWRTESPHVSKDLNGADLSGKDLSGFDLRCVSLKRANLRGAKFSGGSLLCNADLSNSDLQDVNFGGADLFEANLREANLQGADLSGIKGSLRTEQLAGADLTGAKLTDQLKKLYESLENVKGISESARKNFLAVLAGCLYCWLTIATTTDVNLITNRASSPLPIIQTAIPIVGFYVVAPLLVLCVYFYLHFYLQKLWEELGSLPGIFPDGRPLHTKVDPWLLNDLVRAHLPKLNVDRPFLSYLQLCISVLLAWWVVPITMFLFWGRYLTRHERVWTILHIVLLVTSIIAAVWLYKLAVSTLSGTERKPFTWKSALMSRRGYFTAAFAIVLAVVLGLASLGTRWGIPWDKAEPIPGVRPGISGRWTWAPRLMATVDYVPFANLTGAEVSHKKSNWDRNKNDPESVIGAVLYGANLRYASASGAFFSYANLIGADLSGADLMNADLRGAGLLNTDLRGASLFGADLRDAFLGRVDLRGAKLVRANLGRISSLGADLRGADLSGADLQSADLMLANLSGTKLSGANLSHATINFAQNIDPAAMKEAAHWDQALYDDKSLAALGLAPDHNKKLQEQWQKEAELQSKPNPEQLSAPPASSR